MESKPLYSVIIPVYNVEKNIGRCIESVLKQSCGDFELLLIDDGSSDRSWIICEKYQKKDPRIITIHQENQGVSIARNIGLDKARGKYIVFIDSDDFVESDLLYKLDQFDVDLVLVGFSDYLKDKVTKVILDKNERWTIDSDEGIRKFLDKKSSVFVWGKRYKKSIIDKYHIRFRSDMKFSEDIIFNNDYILHTQTVINIEWSGYYHCQYESTTLSSVAEKTSFIERTRWRKISYEQFDGHESVQAIYALQMLYFSEKEISSLSNGKESFYLKYKSIKEIVTDEFFQMCLRFFPDTFSIEMRFLYKYRLIVLLLIKYKNFYKSSRNQ